MDPQLILELVGYFASITVLISMLMTSVVRLRVINLLGSLIYVGYALAIRSYPTAFLNLCLAGVNIWQLIKLRHSAVLFSISRAEICDQTLLHFLSFHGDDIAQFFPDFANYTSEDNTKVFLVFAGAEIASVLIGTQQGTTLQVQLDYSSPKYRDCSAGRFLYSRLRSFGVTKVTAETEHPAHAQYLKKMGFFPQNGIYTKTL